MGVSSSEAVSEVSVLSSGEGLMSVLRSEASVTDDVRGMAMGVRLSAPNCASRNMKRRSSRSVGER